MGHHEDEDDAELAKPATILNFVFSFVADIKHSFGSA